MGPRVSLGECRQSGLPPGFEPWTIQPVANCYTDHFVKQYIYKTIKPSSPCSKWIWISTERIFIEICEEECELVDVVNKQVLFFLSSMVNNTGNYSPPNVMFVTLFVQQNSCTWLAPTWIYQHSKLSGPKYTEIPSACKRLFVEG